MRQALLLVVALAVCYANIIHEFAPVRGKLSDMVDEYGSVDTCENGIHYAVSYNTTGFTGATIIDLGTDVQGVHGVSCDIDQTQLQIDFGELIQLEEFMLRVKFVTDFIVISAPTGWKCAVTNDDGFLLRRIIGASQTSKTSKTLYLDTVIAKYDEIYSTATITYSTLSTPCPDPEVEMHPICIGVNTQQDCNTATKPITIFQNKFVSLTCPDCFLGFSTNLFFTVQIADFKLVDITAGFKNMSMLGNMVFDFKVTADWSVNIDKTVNLVPETTFISFKIGPIPFSFAMAVPVQLQASADFDATAEATAGATFSAKLGDDYNQWTKGAGWSHVSPTPSMAWEPHVTGAWDFSGNAHMSIVPTVKLMISRLYEYDLTFDPQVNMVAYAKHTNPPALCANLTYETTLTAQSQLNINIPWLDIHSHDTWGPTVIFDSGVQPIGNKCVNLSMPTYKAFEPIDPPPADLKVKNTMRAPRTAAATPAKVGKGMPFALLPRAPREMVHEQGQYQECIDGTLFETKFDTVSFGGDVVINLDMAAGLNAVTCDIDETALMLTFATAANAATFVQQVQTVTDFLTGGGKYGCNITASGGGFLLRRILGGQTIGATVFVNTVPAKYDEIYETADLTFASVGRCNGDVGKVGEHGICIGVNTQQDCNAPTANIPIVTSKFININCPDCFLGFETSVFMELHIKGFKLETMQAGFKNMSLNGAIVMTMKAEANWNMQVDKTVNLVPPVTLFSFNIGKVPFAFSFDVPVEIKASAMFDAMAEVTVGATMTGFLGDSYMSFIAGQGWTHVEPTPTFAWSPQATFTQSFNANAQMQIIPTLQVKLANVYEYDLVFTPTVNAVMYEQSTNPLTICANMTAEETLVAQSQLHINIPWLFIHSTDTWGPTTIYDSGVVPIGHVCKAL